ncbi:hypothetical protein BDR04DRAFT_1146216 [Suillus decipiens]|nr:hypothetical protein BDR04DRAFT_1146216 [Suillus decipiens]
MAAVQQTYPDSKLDALFPCPSSTPNILSPPRYPGFSPEAVAALTRVMKENYTKYHIFFNYKRLHNHITHRALALYAMGARGSLIEHFYKEDSAYQRSVVEPPEAITEVNFIEHLGDENFYVAYKTFFSKVFEERGLSSTLEKYIFSKKYNFIEGRDTSTQPLMFGRFLGALFHAFIHVGYGAEMGIPGMVVEGEIERKIDVFWTSTILYSIGGWNKDKSLAADFFLHLVTSSLFLPSLLPYLSQTSQVLLLRGYFASTLGWWVARGFPRLDIQGFFNATSHLLSEAKVANPFLDIVQSAIIHPNGHMLKIQRTFAHFSSLYGARSKSYFKDTELEGAEALDGSLFLRVARLTEEYMSEGTRP